MISVSQFLTHEPAAASAGPPARRSPPLLRHFRAQRPLRGGSLLITLFGDAIAPRGGARDPRQPHPPGGTLRAHRAPGAHLGRAPGARGLAGGAAVHGRRSEYRLSAGGAAALRGRRRAASTAQRPTRWDGRWTLVLLPAGAARAPRLREELRWLGFGQLSAGVFAHPDRHRRAGPRVAAQRCAAPARAACSTQRGERMRRATAQSLARGWDLQELGARLPAVREALRAAGGRRCGAARPDAGGGLRGAHPAHPRVPQDPSAGSAAAARRCCRPAGSARPPTSCAAGCTGAVFAPAEALPGSASAHRLHDRCPQPARGRAGALRRREPSAASARWSITRRALPAERSMRPAAHRHQCW